MIRITRVYSDENGESHFEDIDMPLREDGETGFLSDEIPIKEMDVTSEESWKAAAEKAVSLFG